MNIDDLASTVNGARGVRSVVLENYEAIALARSRLWTWRAIAEALRNDKPGRDACTEALVSQEYRRLTRAMTSGRVKSVGKTPSAVTNGVTKPTKQSKPAKTRGQFQRVGETTTATEDDGLTEAERIINSLHHI